MKKRQRERLNAFLGYFIIILGIGAVFLTIYYVVSGKAPLADLPTGFFGSAILMYVGYQIAKGGEFRPFTFGHS